ncbi:DDE-type integrase/transposase/recombinase [Desulfonatronum sp. SC1]|uniref:DDE-type integrase/transposase/recombinase n=1 Tax=Desulfonatronum sp. SC1 TaxID=2109626 RepID=UPI000D2FA7B4|nr:DDE-type integrase/transposase/recombinase [Desulfonatronum sp. SC1]PTN37330.1 transposase [Desulfonatronum sp. SC1]
MLQINDVLMYGEVRHRVLNSTEEGYVLINIDSIHSFPEYISASEVEAAILSESLKKVDDPYKHLVTQLPEQGTVSQKIRDKRLSIINDLIHNPDIYNRTGRGPLVQQVVNKTGIAKKSIYSYLRQYWQRGSTPNALLPDYDNSGGKGKKRSNSGKKLGRPRSISPGEGSIIDAVIERFFRIVLDRYYLTEKNIPIGYAHRRFMDMYESNNPNIPKEEYPTIGQLRYFYEREYIRSERIRLKSNKINYNKDIRPLQSTATVNTHGPGARYEIDATIADIYLLSSDRQKIIGRPILYVVVDVFSRMIAGFYVGLENPSYATAMLALVNAMTDKSKICKSYGYDIASEDWPCIGLPDAILADRGELLGHQIEYLEQAFGVRIETAPPYRGDAKGIVERCFRTIQADFKPYAPGVVTGTTIKKRGGKDYRLDATLTIQDFTKIIIGSILHRNLYSVLTKYDREPDMPSNLPAVPIRIWQWGIQHRSGRLRNVSETALRLALLPRQKVTISDLGIQCFGVFYTCKELMTSGWLNRTRQQRPGPFMAAYDPGIADHIYFFPDKSKPDYWDCYLTDRSREYRGRSMWELWESQKQLRKVTATWKIQEQNSKRNLENIIQETIKKAEKSRPPHIGESKTETLTGIGNNRQEARDLERQQRQSAKKTSGSKSKATVTNLHEQPEDCAIPDFLDELFGDKE